MNNGMDLFLDLPAQLRGAAGKYGRGMVALVYGAGMSSEAMKTLAAEAARHRSAPGRHALVVLSDVFNQTATALAKKEGWTEEMMAQCDRDIQLAFAGSVQAAETRIILEH